MNFRYDMRACRRVQFGGADGSQDIVLLGHDWTSAAFWMQVRALPGDTTTPLVSIATAAAGTEGIAALYDPTTPDPLTDEVLGATFIRPQINQATLAAIAAGIDPTEPLCLAYDLHAQPPGLPRAVLCWGEFLLFPGVTLP